MQTEIKVKLTEILNKRSGADFGKDESFYTEKLLGNRLGMPARELLHIYFDVEKAFGIKIPEQEIADENFDTAEHIAEIIERQLSHESSNT